MGKGVLTFAFAATLACACSSVVEQNGKTEVKSAEAIYSVQCAICHGHDGRKGLAGAKLIPESTLGLDERIALITNGKGNMMPYRDILTKEEIRKVAAYTLTLP